jgi:hypothetical protein
MTERTGLGPLELAVLRSVSATAGEPGTHTPTTSVMEHLDQVERIGPAYGLTVLQDLGAPWRVHLLLFDLEGNWGSVCGDPPADPRYTRVPLSQLGELVLACEQHRVGPVPIGLVDGSPYRGGEAPPLDPGRALRTVSALLEDETLTEGEIQRMVGLPAVPTGGTVDGDLAGLCAGRSARIVQSCRISREQIPPQQSLVITDTPLGVDVNEIGRYVYERLQAEHWMERQRQGLEPYPDYLPVRPGYRERAPDAPIGLVDVRDESGARGTRVVVVTKADADLDALELGAWGLAGHDRDHVSLSGRADRRASWVGRRLPSGQVWTRRPDPAHLLTTHETFRSPPGSIDCLLARSVSTRVHSRLCRIEPRPFV